MSTRDKDFLTDRELDILEARKIVCASLRRHATVAEIAKHVGKNRQAVYQMLYRLVQRGYLIRDDRHFHAPDDPVDWASIPSPVTLQGATAQNSLRLVIELVGPSRLVLDNIDAAIARLTEMRKSIQGDYRGHAS